MKSKEIYGLVGALVLILAFVWWGSSIDVAPEAPVNAGGETVNTPTTPKKPTSTTKVPSSVNPTVVAEKPVPTTVTAKSLAGSSLRLVTFNGKPVAQGTRFTLTFTDTDFSLKLCNTLTSAY